MIKDNIKDMKVVIFAGGKGTRLAEETALKPKPMVEIGDMPILWHIMKIYSHYNLKNFIICLGYKGYIIKEWFRNYSLHNSDITIDLSRNVVDIHNQMVEDWKITLVDTGLESGTAARLAKVKDYVGDNQFMLTYGDGLADIDLNKLLAFHQSHGKIATVTAIQPEGRFGSFGMDEQGGVRNFGEKIDNKNTWINGGFFVLEPGAFNYIPERDNVMWEQDPLIDLTKNGQLRAFKHSGFWMPMDTLRDKLKLEEHWAGGKAPWKIWQG